jgi:hypothetical protein
VSDSVGRLVRLEEDLGVHVLLSGNRSAVEIAFDALGLGRIASQTLRFRLESQEAGLTVSSFGRVRRW